MFKLLQISLALLTVMLFTLSASAAEKFVIIDENVDDVVKFLTSGSGVASKVGGAAKGSQALQVTGDGGDGQKFNDKVPGWNFKIVENPKAKDEFRYITWAWKKDKGKGIQLQLHGIPDTWGHRYHAGDNVKGWNPSNQVAKEVPTSWAINTQDLFKDWKAFTLTGIAFTAWENGTVSHWDWVVLHQDGKDTAVAVEPKGKLTTMWGKVKKIY